MTNQENNWEKEEWNGWKIVSDMLDHPNELGIYPTSKCYQELYDFVVAQKKKAVLQERQRIIEEIEKMKKDWKADFSLINGRNEPHRVYNQALQEVIDKLK